MSKTIHVLNGDSILPIFQNSGIKGEIVVWREMLCEGTLHKNVGSDEFWLNRYSYFETEVGLSRLQYYDKTIKEIVKLEDLSGYCNVVLWFEYDLFCQVNLLALCTYLLDNYVKKANYYLVCTGYKKNEQHLQSLSNYSSSEFTTLFENKIALSKSNLEFAKETWELYVENNFNKIKEFNFNQNFKFNYLQAAINQHLLRFPSINGLNQIENKILAIINSNVFTAKEIVQKLLIWQLENTVYGFGDLQYFMYLKQLNKYFLIKDDTYYLNEIGKRKLNTNGLQ